MKLLLIFLILVSFNVIFADNIAVILKISKAERFLFNNISKNNLEKRVSNIENNLFGQSQNDSIEKRCNRINNILFSKSLTKPCFAIKLNFCEWLTTKKIYNGNVDKRLSIIESKLFKRSFSIPFIFRIEKISQYIFSKNKWSVFKKNISSMKLIKIKALNTISTFSNKVGDMFNFEVNENLFIDNILFIPKGTIGKGRISYLKKAGRFGRSAKIKIDIDNIYSIGLDEIPVRIIDIPQNNNKKISVATTLSIGGFSLFGPAGLITGAFIKGKNIILKKGKEFFLEITEDTNVIGAKYDE